MPSQLDRPTEVTAHRGCMPTSARPVASVSSLLCPRSSLSTRVLPSSPSATAMPSASVRPTWDRSSCVTAGSLARTGASSLGSQTATTSALAAADMAPQFRSTEVTTHHGSTPISARPVASVSSLLNESRSVSTCVLPSSASATAIPCASVRSLLNSLSSVTAG